MKKSFSVSKPFISKDDINDIKDILKTGWITYGPKSIELEEIVKKKIKSKNVIAVNSATSGIFISLIALGAKKGDEVLTPSNTYISTIHSIYNLGLKIKFCDVNIETGCVDKDIFKNNITKKTKFFIPVHYGGRPSNMNSMIKIAKKLGIKIIEDAATALGSKINGKFIGSYDSSVSVFSLHANKIITSGEGGLISTNNNNVAKKIRLLINSGLTKDTWSRKKLKNYRILNAKLAGYKMNYNDILATIAIKQINKIDKVISYREKLYDHYKKKLHNISKRKLIEFPKLNPNNKNVYYNFEILIKKSKKQRDLLANFLQRKKISTAIYYTPAHKHSFYVKKFKNLKLPNTDYYFERSLSLPFHNNLSLKDVDIITKQVNNFFLNG